MSAAERLWKVLRARLRAGAGEAWERYDAPPAASPRPAVDPLLARYYANLEVPYGSDLETVERAWKRLLRRYHPDVHATDPERQKVADDLVKELNRAYDHLRRTLEKKSA